MEWEKSPPELIDFFDEVAPEDAAVERRKMFGYPACFANGNMFAGLHGRKIVIRLPEDLREEFLKQSGTGQFEPMPGRPMKEYVVASEEMKENREELTSWLEKSLAYSKSLPPKLKKAKR